MTANILVYNLKKKNSQMMLKFFMEYDTRIDYKEYLQYEKVIERQNIDI